MRAVLRSRYKEEKSARNGLRTHAKRGPICDLWWLEQPFEAYCFGASVFFSKGSPSVLYLTITLKIVWDYDRVFV